LQQYIFSIDWLHEACCPQSRRFDVISKRENWQGCSLAVKKNQKNPKAVNATESFLSNQISGDRESRSSVIPERY